MFRCFLCYSRNSLVEERPREVIRKTHRPIAQPALAGQRHHARVLASRALAQTGWNRSDFMGRPVIGIINTWERHFHLPLHLRESRRRCVRACCARGWPIELPAMSLGEVWVKPTTMLYRNFLAMETEELIRSHPVDGVVLMGGCDKTTPALLMGAFSCNLPAIFIPAGRIQCVVQGREVGTGTHHEILERASRRAPAGRRLAGTGKLHDRSPGTCNAGGHSHHDDGGG